MNRTWHQNAIALSGIIGSGKSSVARFLEELGAFVIRADDLAKQAVEPGSEALKRIVAHFGSEVLTESGELDRKKMGQIVFSDPSKRKELQDITHPLIRAKGAEIFEQAYLQPFPLYVYEIPLLFEVGLENAGWKKILLVTSPEEQCIKRIMARDKLSKEDATARLRSQIPLEKKLKKADLVIKNEGTLAELKAKTRDIFDQLVN